MRIFSQIGFALSTDALNCIVYLTKTTNSLYQNPVIYRAGSGGK